MFRDDPFVIDFQHQVLYLSRAEIDRPLRKISNVNVITGIGETDSIMSVRFN